VILYNGEVLVTNDKGNYSFVRGIAPYSAGVIAADGHEIVHTRFLRPLPLAAGLEAMRQHVLTADRPLQAICGIELRSPRPFTFDGFTQFNEKYVRALRELEILSEGLNPIARTNVAPEIGAPAEPSLYGFSYTVRAVAPRRTFVVAGGGELPEGSLNPIDVVRRGETDYYAVQAKAHFVMGLMTGRLVSLGVSWDEATHVNVYTVHPICEFIGDSIVRPMGASSIHGVTWHYSRPPIETIEYEMDLRGTHRELVLTA
jgi:hypothetical protein